MDLKETYNRIAEDWHRDHLPDEWWEEGTRAFDEQLSAGAHILDVGCGSGVKAKYFIGHGMKVTGIDISDKLLEIAKREVPEGNFKELSIASLLHIPRKDAGGVIKKMVRRLTSNGVLYIAVKEIRDDKPKEEMVKENDYGYDYERFFSYFTMAELEQYFAEVGLTVISKLRNPNPSGKTVWLQIIGQK